MDWLNGRWKGSFIFKGLENDIIINYLYLTNKLTLSFPLFNMNNIEINQLCIFETDIQFKIFNNQNYGIVIIKKQNRNNVNHINCIYISPTNCSTTFECEKISEEFMAGKPQYGPTPQLSDLKKLLRCYCVYGYDESQYNIKYPDTNHPLFSNLKKILPLRFNDYDFKEFRYAVKILRWINIFFGTGEMIELPPTRDALSLINGNYKKLNCRGYSILLNDILNSFGVKTRMIKCSAYDVYDLECHYVNEIFCDEWNKWILLDASFGCFISDVTNVPLNLYEIRNNLVLDKSMVLKASLNATRNIDEDNYWYGLIKNIFRMTFYNNYDPGFDNNDTIIQYIEIIPNGYDKILSIQEQNCVFTKNIDYYY